MHTHIHVHTHTHTYTHIHTHIQTHIHTYLYTHTHTHTHTHTQYSPFIQLQLPSLDLLSLHVPAFHHLLCLLIDLLHLTTMGRQICHKVLWQPQTTQSTLLYHTRKKSTPIFEQYISRNVLHQVMCVGLLVAVLQRKQMSKSYGMPTQMCTI